MLVKIILDTSNEITQKYNNFSKKLIDWNIDKKNIRNHEHYKTLWKKLSKIEIKMVKKNEECKHNVGDTFYYDNPYSKPKGVCNALLHVLDLYTWRVIFGFPSWNEKNRDIYVVHCPDAKGTVWEMKKVSKRNIIRRKQKS